MHFSCVVFSIIIASKLTQTVPLTISKLCQLTFAQCVRLFIIHFFRSPSLTNVSERILRQLLDSVDLFVQAIVLQAKKRVGSTRSLASNVVGELDEWIGSVVAAETASVGLMRKSMGMAIASAIETREDEEGQVSIQAKERHANGAL